MVDIKKIQCHYAGSRRLYRLTFNTKRLLFEHRLSEWEFENPLSAVSNVKPDKCVLISAV